MANRRLASAALVAALVALFGGTAGAQFPKLRVPKVPSVPGVKTAPASSSNTLDFSNIDDAFVDKAVKGCNAWQNVHDAEVAKANAKTAEAKAKTAQADALRQKQAQVTVNNMMENAQCKDAFKEKDPRTKEIQRLEDQIAAADERGDEKKSDELKKKADPLSEALDIAADRACGGKGSAALHDCMEKKTAELSKQGLAGPMLQIQAQGACMSDPSTNGVAGMSGPSAEEQALDEAATKLNAEARDILNGANEKAGQAQHDADGLNSHQRALFMEAVIGVKNHDPQIMSQTNEQNRAAITKRINDLQKCQ
jgi:hypothetical protein